jgi:serine/threonine-protein kinase
VPPEPEEPDEDDAAPSQAEGPKPAPQFPLERLHELSGHTLGSYMIKAVLGRGHFGVVFAAHDLKAGYDVALKVLSPEFPRGQAEMQTFAAALKPVLGLKHPNLVTLFKAGKSGPYCWLALEPVEGKSVAQSLAQHDAAGKTHWKSALRLAVHLGRALAYLHARRMVHGNLTPANVLVRQSDKVAKLGDLMFGRALEGSAVQKGRLEKKLLAELGYQVPEQVSPEAFVDPTLSDIYGLGAVVYARLTGRPPFQASTPEQTLRLIMEQTPTRPKAIHRLPDALDAAVMRMLSRQQEHRPQSARELVAEMEAIAAAEGVEV